MKENIQIEKGAKTLGTIFSAGFKLQRENGLVSVEKPENESVVLNHLFVGIFQRSSKYDSCLVTLLRDEQKSGDFPAFKATVQAVSGAYDIGIQGSHADANGSYPPMALAAERDIAPTESGVLWVDESQNMFFTSPHAGPTKVNGFKALGSTLNLVAVKTVSLPRYRRGLF